MLKDYISIPSAPTKKGWQDKYVIYKRDGAGGIIPADPEAIYFPLRLDNDPRAREAALFYADKIQEANPDLAEDIREHVRSGEEIQIRNSGYAD